MVYAGIVAPVLDTAGRSNVLQHHRLPRLAEGDDQQDLVAARNVQGLAQVVALDGADDTAAKAQFDGAEQDALCRDAMIAAG